MRNLLSIFLLSLSVTLSAQSLIYQAGLRGGPAFYLNSGQGMQVGPTAGLDGRVGVVCDIHNNTELRMGFMAGVEISYLSTMLGSALDESFTNYDYYNHPMHYSVSADNAYRALQALNVAVPLYYTLRASGFRLNVGPKFIINAYSSSRVVLRDVVIDAYYPDYGVTVHNELITGVLADGEYDCSVRMPVLTMALSAEVGYEWTMDSFFPYHAHRMGLSAYVDYGVWNTLSGKPNVGQLISVDPISDRFDPVPHVSVNQLTEGYVGALHYLSAGIRLYWCFEDMHRPSYGIHHKWW